VTVATASLPNAARNSPYTATLAASGGTPPYSGSLASGQLPVGLTLAASTGVISGTPTTAGVSNFTVQVSAGVQSATRAFSITITPPGAPVSVYLASQVPTNFAKADLPVELGVRFRSDVAGVISGVRFYKDARNTGTHVGNLWSTTGTLLARATFTNESASGWQQVTFSPAVPIAANTTYIASYFAPIGFYALSPDYFSGAGVDAAPLHLPAATPTEPNGVFVYAATTAFPTQTYQSSNYWVDVLFSTVAPELQSIAVTPTNPTIDALRPARDLWWLPMASRTHPFATSYR